MTARSHLRAAISDAQSAQGYAEDQATRELASAVEHLARALKELEEDGRLKSTSA